MTTSLLDARLPASRGRRRRITRVVLVALLGILALEIIPFAASWIRESARTTPRFDPPVWAGQNVPGACSGGFYARDGEAIVLTIVGHCAQPGATLRDGAGVIGVFGPRAELADCPPERFCAPSDILALTLEPDRIPWGHLNVVDLGAGGYRTIETGTRALACADIEIGGHVEMDGREHYRQGKVLEIGPYQHELDVIFPCMAVADIPVWVGDSGAAVLVDGLPAGVVARTLGGSLPLGGFLGFTPLAEGLENLGLVLCTTPDCDVQPPG